MNDCDKPYPNEKMHEHDTIRSRTTGRQQEISMGPQSGGRVPANPFASKSQQRFMFAAEARGAVPKGTAKHWAKETPNIKQLPEHVKHLKK